MVSNLLSFSLIWRECCYKQNSFCAVTLLRKRYLIFLLEDEVKYQSQTTLFAAQYNITGSLQAKQQNSQQHSLPSFNRTKRLRIQFTSHEDHMNVLNNNVYLTITIKEVPQESQDNQNNMRASFTFAMFVSLILSLYFRRLKLQTNSQKNRKTRRQPWKTWYQETETETRGRNPPGQRIGISAETRNHLPYSRP